MSQDRSVVVAQSGAFGSLMAPATMEAAQEAASLLAKSDMVPESYRGKAADILIAGAMGSRLGLDWFSSLSGIAVIKGRPCLWGDALLAVCMSTPDWVDMQEEYRGEPYKPAFSAVCTVQRKGRAPVVVAFSVEDAQKSGLWGKAGPWQAFPRRMLSMRARAQALRAAFADRLAGFSAREEMEDEPRDVTADTTVTASEWTPPTAIAASVTTPAAPVVTPAPPIRTDFTVNCQVVDPSQRQLTGLDQRTLDAAAVVGVDVATSGQPILSPVATPTVIPTVSPATLSGTPPAAVAAPVEAEAIPTATPAPVPSSSPSALAVQVLATATKLHNLSPEGRRALKGITEAFQVKKVQDLPTDDIRRAFLVRCEEELELLEKGAI